MLDMDVIEPQGRAGQPYIHRPLQLVHPILAPYTSDNNITSHPMFLTLSTRRLLLHCRTSMKYTSPPSRVPSTFKLPTLRKQPNHLSQILFLPFISFTNRFRTFLTKRSTGSIELCIFIRGRHTPQKSAHVVAIPAVMLLGRRHHV